MQTHILAMGKWKNCPERDLFETYQARLRPQAILKELDVRKKLVGRELKAAEAELLLSHIPQGSVVVCLDERAKALGSRGFADKMKSWEEAGRRDVTFVIGGADGLAPEVRKAADLLLGFGVMTWPHMMVRAMLGEQLFRAQCINTGHPYHRD